MSLLIATDIHVSFGSKVLFDAASFNIGVNDRIGLVGANGTGKSTLLKVLNGMQVPDNGRLVFRRRARVGYLPQDLTSLPEGNLVESVLSTVPGRDTIDTRLAETEAALAAAAGDDDEQMELATLLAELHEERDHFEQRFGRHFAERILLGLGFKLRDFEQDASKFSGGWRMRAALAGLLLQDPDLLLLDEPTNHLDLPTLAWFDGFLKRSRKAMVLISHDREFLNRQIGKVISLETEGLRVWSGNYEDYRRQRADEYERLLAQSEKIEAKREQLQAFVNRFKAKASKAAQAQSKMKQLAKMETVELHQARDTVSFRFPPVTPSGRDVARFVGVSKAWGENVVYDKADGQILRGQRIAVVGLNGAGKTTLLKLLAGEIEPDAGKVEFGHNVSLGYYAQHHAETLDKRKTILEEMMDLVPEKPQSFVRSVLGAFLFSGDDVDKPIGVLSGGERARVALARLLLKPANLLVMDEPTNHLDLDSSEALIEALENYDGTLIFVSHNRSFLDALATEIWDVRRAKIVNFPGNLADYLHHLELDASSREQGVEPTEEGEGGSAKTEKDRRREEAASRQAKSQRISPLKKEIAALELKISKVEAAQKEREQQLVDVTFISDYAKSRPVMEAHREAVLELESLYARWEEASSTLASLT